MDNLQAQYDEVTDYLNEYQKFIAGFSPRVARRMFRSPRDYFQFNAAFLKRMWRFDPLSEKTQDTVKEAVEALATDEEKQNQFFQIATSDYPTDALSDALKGRFPGFSFDKIKKLHDAKQAQLARFRISQVLGVVMTASAILLKSIPKTVVESWGLNYSDFERAVFWTTLLIAGYLLVALLFPWIKYQRARSRSRPVGDILEYVVIKNG